MSMIEFILTPWFWMLIGILIIWSIFWKAWGLWRAGNRKDKGWFIVLFVLNTAGILPIIYLYLTKKKKKTKKKSI